MARYITMTLPARIIIDGAGGGDVVFRELTLGEYLETDAADRVAVSLHSFRGAKLPVGAEREEWARALPAAAGRLFADAVTRLHNPDPADFASFKASRDPRPDGAAWKLPDEFGGTLVEVHELTFGQVEDVLSSARAAKNRAPALALASRATGMAPGALHALPSRAGVLVLAAYNEIHSATNEEDESFFGGRQTSEAPPKTI